MVFAAMFYSRPWCQYLCPLHRHGTEGLFDWCRRQVATTWQKLRPAKTGLSATLWSLVFAVSLLLAAAHLAFSTRDQAQQETGLIEATFTQAAERP
jgi:hypothetical protein